MPPCLRSRAGLVSHVQRDAQAFLNKRQLAQHSTNLCNVLLLTALPLSSLRGAFFKCSRYPIDESRRRRGELLSTVRHRTILMICNEEHVLLSACMYSAPLSLKQAQFHSLSFFFPHFLVSFSRSIKKYVFIGQKTVLVSGSSAQDSKKV